jgi:hypothetical protein
MKMAEKKEHAELRKIIKNWVKLNFGDYNLTIIDDDPGNPLGFSVPTLQGSTPDLYGHSLKHGIEIVGEAKTSNDINNKHTEKQLKAYIEHLNVYKNKGYLIVAVSLQDREEMINFIRKIVREININILLNILVIDDIFKDITVAWDVR